MMSIYLIMLLAALFVGVLLWILPHIIWLGVWAYRECRHHKPPRYAPFAWIGLTLVALAWALMAYSFFIGRFQMEVNRFTYAHHTIPAEFNGYKIVQISDLHLSTYIDRPAGLQHIVDAVNAQQPDLICITGDVVSIGVNEAKPFRTILQQLCAKDAILSVFGNHDMMIYADLNEQQRMQAVEEMYHFEKDSLGWIVLRDTAQVIERNGQKITILGVDNCSYSDVGYRTIYAGNLPKAMAHTDGFRILLSHDPTLWRAEVLAHTNIPLTLSGHTHAGQARLFGWPLAAMAFEETEGWYQENGQALYVNRGIGGTLPVRYQCPSEITVFTLQNTPV